ncbi:MAG: hypothetical protein MJ211_01345 [Bacteroidales bacterium]|nr:hypothetical protein [Bacteroidales bacterium]
MKKTILTLTLGTLSLCSMAQDENYTNGCVVEIYDTDGDFTNIRNGAGGAIVDKIPTQTEYRFELTDGKEDNNGWVWIKNGKVYKFEQDANDKPTSYFEVKFSGSTSGYWIHNSVLKLNSLNDGIILREKPDNSSAIKYEVSHSVTLRPIKLKNNYIYLKTKDGKYEGWTEACNVCLNTLMHGLETDNEYSGYPNIFYQLNHSLKVNNGINIESFVEATGLEGEYGWSTDPIFDKVNGFFNYAEEGDGIIEYYGVYWNRTDGKKMFIISYRKYEHDNIYFDQSNENSEWYKIRVADSGHNGYKDFEEIGSIAYLYNPTNQKLEPMKNPPYNNIPKTDDFMFLELPRQGKDIKIHQHNSENTENEEIHTLKFNGLTFDYIK